MERIRDGAAIHLVAVVSPRLDPEGGSGSTRHTRGAHLISINVLLCSRVHGHSVERAVLQKRR